MDLIDERLSEASRQITSGNLYFVRGALERAFERHGRPKALVCDNGPEFIAKAIQQWLKGNGIKTLYIDPGCPWQNGYAESFNSRFRGGCLDRELIYTLSESRVVFSDWRDYYNKQRPHRSLGLITPSEFATKQIEAPSRSGRPTGSLRRKDKNNNINHENPFENLSLEPG